MSLSIYKVERKLKSVFNSKFEKFFRNCAACYLISKEVEAGSVSFLIYDAQENKLKCEGRFIHPNFIISTKKRYNKSIKDLTTGDYENFIFNKIISQHDYAQSSKLDTKTQLNKNKWIQKLHINYQEENHHLGLEQTLSTQIYKSFFDISAITNFKLSANKSSVLLNANGLMAFLINEKKFKTECKSHLHSSFGLSTPLESIYLSIPLKSRTGKIFGLIRFQFEVNKGKEIVKEYLESSTNSDTINKILIYTDIIGDNLGQTDMLDAYRKINLKHLLNSEFSEMDLLANELAKITNCSGCIIRSNYSTEEFDSKGKFTIKGCSKSLENYRQNIEKTKSDIFIKNGDIIPEITTVFQKFNPSTNDINISAIKIRFTKSTTHIAFFSIQNETSISLNHDKKLKPVRKLLKSKFTKHISFFIENNIYEILALPINNCQFGLITFSQSIVGEFEEQDIELLLPVVRRIGMEMKYRTDSSVMINKEKQQALIQSSRVLLHQLGSPITALRDILLNYIHKRIPEDKIRFREEEMINIYKNFLDNLETQQFFFNIQSKEFIMEANYEEFNLEIFLIDIARTYQTNAESQRKCKINVIKVGHNKFGVRSDKFLLKNLLQCLIDNAIKYSYNEEMRKAISVNLKVEIPPMIYIIFQNTVNLFSISVKNFGLLVPNHEKNKIFELEYRSPEADKFDPKGAGIGLYIVKEITNKLGGKIQIDSGNHATTFSVTIPKNL